MKIIIPSRDDIPETSLYVKVIKQSSDTQWDREVMFLIPGGPGGNHTLYSDIEKELLQFADLVIIDLRGCGYSDKSDVEFCTLEHHIDDIEALRKALNIDRPIIHGCSYGAMVALGYGIFYPENLSKLILSSGAASGEFITSAKKNLEDRGTHKQIETAKILWESRFQNAEQFSEYYKIMTPLYIYNSQSSELAPTSQSNIPYNIDLVNYAFKGFLKAFNYKPFLKNVKAKTLIISGQNDWITDPEQANILHAGIKNSSLAILDQCGHFPWKDQKTQFFSNLSAFLI